jgi:hypothetical protein
MINWRRTKELVTHYAGAVESVRSLHWPRAKQLDSKTGIVSDRHLILCEAFPEQEERFKVKLEDELVWCFSSYQ